MTQWFLDTIEAWGYFGIFFWMALENIIPPIPSEVIMGFAGIAVAHGKMDFIAVIVAGTVGSTGGNYFWYWVGRKFGLARLRPFVERNGRWLTIDWSDVERIDRFFKRHGQWLVFALRFAPFGRTMVSLPAGLCHMPRWKFLIWTVAGVTIWNVFLTGAGYWLGENFRSAERWTGPLATVLIVGVAVGYVWRVITWKPRG
jgi:membrane protein DedA with SNARE-associated domain